ncbi:phospholipase D family protein [Verticiella alkaliphila]|uniref:phospholipase D family protein n=1 Tax=Verticiella alkaliphila TaxID=2779529 RepID=UPI001C0C7B4B|nr:phospholipase D family protein [Verticiella sp. GG226]
MRRFVRRTLIVLVVLIVAALLALLAYSHFAQGALGPPSSAIPVQPAQTRLDRAIAPLLQAHPDHSGLALVSDNADAFAIRAVSARAAERSLDVQYYIWHDDLTGRLLLQELLRAAERGVRVRLLVDDINAHGTELSLMSLAQHPNVEVRLFNPTRNRGGSIGRAVEMLLRAVSLNRRMHNKAWIADGRVAIVGGRNVGNEYFDADQQMNFLDADLAIVGPAVPQTEAIFDAFWNSKGALPVEALVDGEEVVPLQASSGAWTAEAGEKEAGPYLRQIAESATVRDLVQGKARLHWTKEAQVVSDPPEKAFGESRDEADWLIAQIADQAAEAQHAFTMISPYFVPGADGEKALRAAAERGIRIEILTNSLASNDVLAVHSGYLRYRQPLLEAGIVLRELMPFGPSGSSLFGSSGASLHTKAYVVDDDSAFVGSFNFDPRSVRLNTEMGVRFRHRELAQEVMALYQRYAGPEKSYGVALEDGRVVWLDEREEPPRRLAQEPETTRWQRAVVSVLRWLPIESQL